MPRRVMGWMKLLASLASFAVACSGSTASAPAAGSDLDLGGLGGKHVDSGSGSGSAVAAKPPPPPEAPKQPPAPPPSKGVSFRDDALLIYKIAACGGAAADRIPDSLGDPIKRDKLAKVVERHCKNLLERIDKFRTAYFENRGVFFDDLVPDDAPKTVVYPFGGGDLLSALVAFPHATEITTISLELAGDPRRLRTLDPDSLGNSLAALRVEIGGLLSVGSNTSQNLSAQQRNDIPGQVASFMMGLVAGGYEPVDMRYFKLDDAGGIKYLEQADIDAVDKTRNKALKGDWQSPSFSEAFSHVEITYRSLGDTQVRVHRHFGWNLDDEHLAKAPQLVKHLAAKGKVTLLTKGASYLLHRPTFSTIRQYMLDHLAWMLSDSTGIPPLFAEPAGMVQVPYGTYSGAFLEGSRGTRADRSFVELWRNQPRKKLGFRFGYVDASGAGHLVVTKPK